MDGRLDLLHPMDIALTVLCQRNEPPSSLCSKSESQNNDGYSNHWKTPLVDCPYLLVLRRMFDHPRGKAPSEAKYGCALHGYATNQCCSGIRHAGIFRGASRGSDGRIRIQAGIQ